MLCTTAINTSNTIKTQTDGGTRVDHGSLFSGPDPTRGWTRPVVNSARDCAARWTKRMSTPWPGLTGDVAVLENLRHQLLGRHHAETCRQHPIERRRLAALCAQQTSEFYTVVMLLA